MQVFVTYEIINILLLLLCYNSICQFMDEKNVEGSARIVIWALLLFFFIPVTLMSAIKLFLNKH